MNAPDAVYRRDGIHVTTVRVTVDGLTRDGCPACLTPFEDERDGCVNDRCERWTPLCDVTIHHHHLRGGDILLCHSQRCTDPAGGPMWPDPYGPMYPGPHD